jgi:hypothetical protein
MIAAATTILLFLLAMLFAVKMTTKAKNAVTIRPEIQMLLDLMAMDKDWQKDQHVWYHPSGVSVWVGNKHIGLSVKWGSKDINDYAALSTSRGGRLNNDEWRKALKIMNGVVDARDEVNVAAVAARIAEMYK